MKKLLYLFLVLILVSCGSEKAANISSDSSKVALNAAKETSTEASSMKISAQSITSEMGKGKYKEGELLVKFKSGVIGISSTKIHQAVGASVIKRFNVVPNLERIKIPESMSIEEAILQYMSDPNVEYAEPNYIRCASSIEPPNDTYFNNQWALNNTGEYANGMAGADIKALDAWRFAIGSPDIFVAVLDSGIDYNHQDLVGNIWDFKGWDFANDDNDPMDDDGHGTHVAGIIGAVGNNGTGIAGVMWKVKLMPLKIFNADTRLTGSCTSAYASDEVEAIYYAVNNGAKIINASINGEGYCISEYNAINYANSKGVLFVAAAGNGGEDFIGDNNDLTPHYPSSYNLPNIIAVAATDQNDRRASFSNFGLNSVHVAAPGVYILSTVPQNMYADKEFNWGTSMAAPHVSGLAGLLYSYYDGDHNTKFDYSQVRATILKCVDKKETLDGWIQTGGRINAYKAVASLAIPTNLTATATSPTQISLTWKDNAMCKDRYKIERKESGGHWIVLTDTLPENSSSFIDSTVAPGTAYTYRVTAVNTIAESFPSEDADTTTPVAKSSDGGGGCSIGAKQNTPTAIADTAVMLIPLIFIAIMRRRR